MLEFQVRFENFFNEESTRQLRSPTNDLKCNQNNLLKKKNASGKRAHNVSFAGLPHQVHGASFFIEAESQENEKHHTLTIFPRTIVSIS